MRFFLLKISVDNLIFRTAGVSGLCTA